MPESETVKTLFQYDDSSREITLGELKVNVLSSEIPIGFGFVGGDVSSVNVLVIPVKLRPPCGPHSHLNLVMHIWGINIYIYFLL
jgi:hypothetical protein